MRTTFTFAIIFTFIAVALTVHDEYDAARGAWGAAVVLGLAAVCLTVAKEMKK